MTEQELTAVVNGVVAAVRGELSQLKARVDAIEQLQSVPGQLESIREQLDRLDECQRKASDRADAMAVEIGKTVGKATIAAEDSAKRVFSNLALPLNGKDGKDADPAEVNALKDRVGLMEAKLSEFMTEGYERTFDIEAVTANVIAQTRHQWPQPVHGKDGTSVTVDDVMPAIDAAIQKAVAAIHIPKDGAPGKSVDPEEVDAMVSRHVAAAIALIPTPKDGVGIVDALVNRAGSLVVTMSDGTTKDVGPIVGRDVDMVAVERLIREEIAKIPTPQDGKDGLGFDDFEEEFDGERTYIRRYKRGDDVKEYKSVIPFVLDRGVWKGGTKYERGDGVTYAGSFWICQQETSARPGDAQDESRAWRLAVKKGADGKEGKVGPQGLQGNKGDKGDPGRSYS